MNKGDVKVGDTVILKTTNTLHKIIEINSGWYSLENVAKKQRLNSLEKPSQPKQQPSKPRSPIISHRKPSFEETPFDIDFSISSVSKVDDKKDIVKVNGADIYVKIPSYGELNESSFDKVLDITASQTDVNTLIHTILHAHNNSEDLEKIKEELSQITDIVYEGFAKEEHKKIEHVESSREKESEKSNASFQTQLEIAYKKLNLLEKQDKTDKVVKMIIELQTKIADLELKIELENSFGKNSHKSNRRSKDKKIIRKYSGFGKKNKTKRSRHVKHIRSNRKQIKKSRFGKIYGLQSSPGYSGVYPLMSNPNIVIQGDPMYQSTTAPTLDNVVRDYKLNIPTI